MNCEEALTLLSAGLDGAVGPEEAGALEAHLASCPQCRRLAAELEGLDRSLAALKEPAPEGLKQGVLYRIDQASGKAKTRSRRFRPGTALGAVAALLVLLVGTGLIKLPSRQTRANDAEHAETGAPGYAEYEDPRLAPESARAPAYTDVWVVPPNYGENNYSGVDRNDDGMEPAKELSPAESGKKDAANTSSQDTEVSMDMDSLQARCGALSEAEEALVLAYADIDPDSLFTLLEREAPELYRLTSELEPREENGLLLYPTDCGTALALQEWLTAQIAVNGETVRGASLLTETLEQLDPGSSSLRRVIRLETPGHQVAWPESWPGAWALELQRGSNWILRYPSEDYVPREAAPAYLVFEAEP